MFLQAGRSPATFDALRIAPKSMRCSRKVAGAHKASGACRSASNRNVPDHARRKPQDQQQDTPEPGLHVKAVPCQVPGGTQEQVRRGVRDKPPHMLSGASRVGRAAPPAHMGRCARVRQGVVDANSGGGRGISGRIRTVLPPWSCPWKASASKRSTCKSFAAPLRAARDPSP